MTEPAPELPPSEPQSEGESKDSRPDWLVGSDEGLDARAFGGVHELTGKPADMSVLRRLAPDPPPRPVQPPVPFKPPTPRQTNGVGEERSDGMFESMSATFASMETTRKQAQDAPDAVEPPPKKNGSTAEKPVWKTDAAAVKSAEVTPAPRWKFNPTAIEDEEKPKPTAGESLARLASDRRVQIAVVIVAAVFVVMTMRSSMKPALLLSNVRRHPEQFDGQLVTVRGRVGDVFAVGGGYAFNLIQGRDTLVVFSKLRTPVFRQTVTVTGSVSTGYLEGKARAAVFEEPTR